MEKKFTMLKRQAITLAVVSAMGLTGLTGCKKAEPSESTVESTIETTVELPTEPTVTVADMTTEANKLYEENKEFFINLYGEDKEAAIKDLNNALLVLTNNAKNINDEDLRKAFYALDNIFMPTNVIQAAGNYLTNQEVEHVDKLPDLGQYVKDNEAKAIISVNTEIINNFIGALNNGTEEEKANARILLLQRVATIEENLDEYYYLGELSTADELALNMSNKGLVNLTGSLVVNGVLNYTDANGVNQTRFLIADTRGAAILNTFRLAEADGAPFDTKVIDGATVNGRYVEYLGPNGFEREFITQAEKNTIEDTLAITKYDEATVMLENNIADQNNDMTDGCNSKTLTK